MRSERRPNYYTLLDVDAGATDAEIKAAWHDHIQVWHPDRFVHSPTLHRKAEARTQLINQAYQVLSDPAARAKYDAAGPAGPRSTAAPPAPDRPASAPPSAPRPRQARRGPQAMLNIIRFGRPTIMVPAIHLLVDPRVPQPYEFKGLPRIAGIRRQSLLAGDYAVAEAPAIFGALCRPAADLTTIVSNPFGERPRFLESLAPLLAVPHRFLVIEGALHYPTAGRLGEYHRTGMVDFLDALTARFGLQIVQTDGRAEAEERLANLAAFHYAYHLAESEGLGRCLIEQDT